MQIILDRRTCNHSQGTCEACFGEHLRRDDFETADCSLNVLDDSRPETVFKIYDRGGGIKKLVVNAENMAIACASWLLLWEEQAGLVI